MARQNDVPCLPPSLVPAHLEHDIWTLDDQPSATSWRRSEVVVSLTVKHLRALRPWDSALREQHRTRSAASLYQHRVDRRPLGGPVQHAQLRFCSPAKRTAAYKRLERIIVLLLSSIWAHSQASQIVKVKILASRRRYARSMAHPRSKYAQPRGPKGSPEIRVDA
ncbi:hypothetical protein PsYK624_149910 [Phanerochaete sordida]|uniref:Uncharacterized protein n=1 Tax=Phanerochaete sordida TaxID=48140 RepID=A0A9P3LKW0_9APHY|nr:hypothetical protein PsYK624_149910 [Phanerochaete sordida]